MFSDNQYLLDHGYDVGFGQEAYLMMLAFA